MNHQGRRGSLRTRLAGPAGAVAAAGAARGAYALLRRHPPAGEQTWIRTNHRGEVVTLAEGPAVPLGAIAGELAGAAVAGQGGALPPAVAGLGALGFGVLDDLHGSGARRGLRGHLGALARGEVTTGAVKLAGLAATGLGAAVLDGGDAADVAVNAGLIAGGANLLNLFDLRPGRAIKVAALSAGLIAAGGALTASSAGRSGAGARQGGLAAVAAPAAAALALLPEDLREQAMLGDAGANALGAMLGTAAARSLPRPARIGLLGVIVTLTVASERVSFTRVIAATPPLNWLDMLGRRPAPLTAPVRAEVKGAAPVAVGAEAAAAAGGPRGLRRRPGRHRRADPTMSDFRAWFSTRLRPHAPREP